MNWNRFEADVASQTSALLQSRPLEFSYDRSPVRDPQLAQISHELGSDPSPTAVNNKFGINYLPTGADVLNLGGMKVGEARTASVLVMERDINEMMTTIRGQNEKIAKLERIISSHGASTEYSTNALKTQIEWIERQQTASTESITKLTKNQGDESRRINIFGRKMKDFFYQQSSHDERLEEISQSQRNLLQLVQSTVTQVGDLSSTVETLRARSFQASSFAESLLQALIDLNGQITSTSDVMVHTKHIGQLLTGAINTTTKALSDSISENEASSKQKIQGLQQNLTSLSESLQLVRVDNQALTEKSDQVQRLASAISTRDGAYQSRLDSNEGNIQSLRLTLDLTRKQTETNLLKVTEFNESIRRICADVDEIKLRKYIEEDTIAGHTEVQFDQKLKHMGDELMKLSTDLNSVINSEKEANEVEFHSLKEKIKYLQSNLSNGRSAKFTELEGQMLDVEANQKGFVGSLAGLREQASELRDQMSQMKVDMTDSRDTQKYVQLDAFTQLQAQQKTTQNNLNRLQTDISFIQDVQSEVQMSLILFEKEKKEQDEKLRRAQTSSQEKTLACREASLTEEVVVMVDGNDQNKNQVLDGHDKNINEVDMVDSMDLESRLFQARTAAKEEVAKERSMLGADEFMDIPDEAEDHDSSDSRIKSRETTTLSTAEKSSVTDHGNLESTIREKMKSDQTVHDKEEDNSSSEEPGDAQDLDEIEMVSSPRAKKEENNTAFRDPTPEAKPVVTLDKPNPSSGKDTFGVNLEELSLPGSDGTSFSDDTFESDDANDKEEKPSASTTVDAFERISAASIGNSLNLSDSSSDDFSTTDVPDANKLSDFNLSSEGHVVIEDKFAMATRPSPFKDLSPIRKNEAREKKRHEAIRKSREDRNRAEETTCGLSPSKVLIQHISDKSANSHSEADDAGVSNASKLNDRKSSLAEPVVTGSLLGRRSSKLKSLTESASDPAFSAGPKSFPGENILPAYAEEDSRGAIDIAREATSSAAATAAAAHRATMSCKQTVLSRLQDGKSHVAAVVGGRVETAQCSYCLKRLPRDSMREHVQSCNLRMESWFVLHIICLSFFILLIYSVYFSYSSGCNCKVRYIKLEKHKREECPTRFRRSPLPPPPPS
jgi:hypothetical protein